jgi:hypothetical protein
MIWPLVVMCGRCICQIGQVARRLKLQIVRDSAESPYLRFGNAVRIADVSNMVVNRRLDRISGRSRDAVRLTIELPHDRSWSFAIDISSDRKNIVKRSMDRNMGRGLLTKKV